jgi:hypothetical protein
MFEYDLPYYFAGIPFTARQVPRKLAWLLARGEIRQILKDVYVDVRVRDSPQLRADGLRLVVPPDAVVCGRAAAWLHGIDTTALGPGDLMQAQWTRQVADLDVVEVDGLRVTSPATTALALAMQLPRPFALSAVDAFLHSGRADRWACAPPPPPTKAAPATAKAKTSSSTPTAAPPPPPLVAAQPRPAGGYDTVGIAWEWD